MGYEDYWNLAGIPVDARFEAQRAAREAGVSVGDWLTRRILSEASTVATHRSHSGDPLSDHFRDLKTSLNDLELQLHAYPTREAVEKLHEQLARLTNDMVQTAGRSSIELSALANRTGDLEAKVQDAHVATAEAVEAKLAEFARLTMAQRANSAAELAAFAARLDRLANEAAQTSQTISQELARLNEQSAAEQRTLTGQVLALRQGLDKAGTETSGRHAALEKRLDTVFAQATGRLTERLEDLSAGLDVVRKDASGAAATLTQQLKQVTDQATADDDALAARIDALAGDLAGLRGNALNADAIGQQLAPLSDRLAALETALPDRTAGLESKIQRLLSDRLETLETALADRSAELEAKAQSLHAGQTNELTEIGNKVASLGDDLAGAKQAFASQLSDHAANVSSDVAARHQALSARINDLRNGMDAARNEATGRHEALEKRLGSAVTQTADALAGKIEALSGHLGEARNESAAATQTLDAQLKQAIEQVVTRDAALTAKLAELDAALESARSEKAEASQVLEQRVSQLTRLFGDAQIAAAGENEKLHARLGEFQAQTADTIRSLQEQQAGVQADFATRDAADEDHHRARKADIETLAGKLASLQSDLASLAERHTAHEGDTHAALEQMETRLDANRTSAQQASGTLGDRLSEVSGGLDKLEARLESGTKRSAEEAARNSEQTQGKIAALTQSLEETRQQAAAHASDVTNALQTEAQERSRIEGLIPGKQELKTRLAEIEDGASKRIVSLANNMQSLAELLAATRGEAANASAVLAERLSALQTALENSDARSGDVSSALAACVQSVHDLKSGTTTDTGILNRLVRKNNDDATNKLSILAGKLLDMRDRLDAFEKETPAKTGAVQKLLVAINGILDNIDERRHPIGAALPQAQTEATAASLSNLEEALAELDAAPAAQEAAEEPAHEEVAAQPLFDPEEIEPTAVTEEPHREEVAAQPLFDPEEIEPVASPDIREHEPEVAQPAEAHVAHSAEPEEPDHLPDPVAEPEHVFAVMDHAEIAASEEHETTSATQFLDAIEGYYAKQPHSEEEHEAPLKETAGAPVVVEAGQPEVEPSVANVQEAPHAGGETPVSTSETKADAPAPVAEDPAAADKPGDLRPAASYLSAVRQSASAAHLSAIEPAEDGTLRSAMQSFAHGSMQKPHARLLAGAAVVAAGVLGTGLVLELSSHHKPVSHHPVVTADAKTAKAVALKPAIVNPAGDLDHIVALARGGDAHAQLQVGLRYLLGTNGVAPRPDEALKWLEMAANKGEPVAQYRAGALYSGATGIKPDPAKALQYFRSAADAGNRKAMYNLALAYVRGAGTKADNSEAVRWFLKAANLGLVDAQFDLAVLYERGNGVPQSLMDAYRWYAIAAKEGDIQSKQRAEALSTQLPADDRTAAEVAAEQFKPMPMDPRANEVRP